MTSGTVLLVEDDPAIGRLLVMMLQMWGFQTLAATNAREALDLALAHRNEITLVVSDVHLTGESGPSVAAKIRSICPRIKTLFTSGSPFDILSEGGLLTRELLEDGDTSYIQKPFLPATLKAAIDCLMNVAPKSPVDTWKTGVRYAAAAY